MLNDRESGYLAGQLATMAYEEHSERVTMITPAYVLKPQLYMEGNQWMALLGDFMTGVAGFGDSPHDAYEDFNREWRKPIDKKIRQPKQEPKNETD